MPGGQDMWRIQGRRSCSGTARRCPIWEGDECLESRRSAVLENEKVLEDPFAELGARLENIRQFSRNTAEFLAPLIKSDFSSHNSSQVIALRWKRAREISRWNFHGWSRRPCDRACRMELGERGRHASGRLCAALVWNWADRAIGSADLAVEIMASLLA